jgi:hypothetical protein
MGPPKLETLGEAAYANVPTRPTNSSNALSERFMVFTFSLGSAGGWRLIADLQRGGLYTPLQLSDSLEVTSDPRMTGPTDEYAENCWACAAGNIYGVYAAFLR